MYYPFYQISFNHFSSFITKHASNQLNLWHENMHALHYDTALTLQVFNTQENKETTL